LDPSVEGRRIGRKAGYHVEEQGVADMEGVFSGGSGVNSREFTVADYIRDLVPHLQLWWKMV